MKQTKMQIILKIVLCAYLIVGLAGIWLYSKNSVSLSAASKNEAQEEIDLIDRQDISEKDEENEEAVEEPEAVEDTESEDDSDEEETDSAEDADTTEDTSSDEEAAINPGDYAGTATVATNVKGLNLRTGPGKEYRVIKDFHTGDVLYLIEVNSEDNDDGWTHVTDGSVEGYMATQFLEINLN